VLDVIQFIKTKILPDDDKQAKRIVLQALQFTLVDDILYYLDSKQEHWRRAVVLYHLCEQVLDEHHGLALGRHLSWKEMYGTFVCHWWWDGMYRDTLRFARNFPECATVTGNT